MMDVRQRNGGTSQQQQQHQQQRSVAAVENSIGIGQRNPLRSSNNNSGSKSISKRNTTGMATTTWITSCGCSIILAFILIGLGVMSGTVSLTYNNISDSVTGQQQQMVRGASEQRRETADITQQQTKELELIRKENVLLKKELQKLKNTAELSAGGDTTKLQGRISRLVETTERMRTMIQLVSKHHLMEKYGIGPHYVEVIVSFDPQSNIADHTKQSNGGNKDADADIETLLIEMAPMEEMPATVFWFLQQVNATIYNGASFHRNAHHVVQGGPIGNFESKTGDVQRIRDTIKSTGLDSVPFQEYSPNFPHVKYTLGYAGRPGGPDFYVSTQDNTKNHGPGGQASYEEASEADPCFAKVVPGYEHVVDRMHKSEVQPGNYMRMKQYVAIRTMRLVPPEQVQELLQVQ